jgi:hypothetical protein
VGYWIWTRNAQKCQEKVSGTLFVEVIILACWSIWKQRNNLIFKEIKPPSKLGRLGSF